ncbi:GNAT family N-acetyltransferase [Microbulbifer agarilyticus]|nr:GNAT family N-acetyltransferase [Microbulbifer agarilyticus]
MHKYSLEISEENDSSDLSRVKYSFDDIQIVRYREKDVGMIKMSKDYSENHWYIYQFQVDPEFQGIGIGKAILNDICKSAVSVNATIGLSVFKNNPAISLYRGLGFKDVASSKYEFEMEFNA